MAFVKYILTNSKTIGGLFCFSTFAWGWTTTSRSGSWRKWPNNTDEASEEGRQSWSVLNETEVVLKSPTPSCVVDGRGTRN